MTIPPRTELTARSLFGRAITLDLPTDYIDARSVAMTIHALPVLRPILAYAQGAQR